MDVVSAMLLLGIIIGITAGCFLTWWFSRKGPPPEPFFLRFLRAENRSARLDTRLMLHELHRKVDALSQQVRRMDLDLESLKEKTNPKGSPSKEDTFNSSDEPLQGLERCKEIYRLFEEGLSADDIARHLKMGKGEVDLVLSLDKKPPWVIKAKN